MKNLRERRRRMLSSVQQRHAGIRGYLSVFAAITFFLFVGNAYTQELALPATGVWNGFLEHLNVVECANLGVGEANLSLTARNNDGEIIGSLDFVLAANATRHIILNEFGITDSYGTYRIEETGGRSSSTKISCHTAVYRMAPGGGYKQIEYAFSLPVINSVQGETAGIYNSMNPEGGETPIFNWLSVYNTDTVPFSASVEVYDADGSVDQALSFSIDNLSPGERGDFALHEQGQTVGLYRIVPENSDVSYGAFLSRYSSKGSRYNFAFPLLSLPGSCTLESLPASSMGDALNWGEVANPTGDEISALIEVSSREGESLYQETRIIAPYSQYHLFLNEHIGENNVGKFTVSCAPGSTSGQRLLVQSLYYGRTSAGAPAVEWAYASQAQGITGGDGVSLAFPVNTFLGAANWSKYLLESQQSLSLLAGLYNSQGETVAHSLTPQTLSGALDLAVHEEVGGDFTGLLVGSSGTSGGLFSSELLRVYPAQNGNIGYIMNVSSSVIDNSDGGPPPNGPGAFRLAGAVASETTADSATIIWSTDVPSVGVVEYGLDESYGNTTVVDSSFLEDHSHTLTGLSSNTTYHYRVRATSVGGSEVVSADYTFSTDIVEGVHRQPSEINSGGRPIVEIRSEGVRRIDQPIILEADTYYLLQSDIHAEGTALWFSGENITLDLNQYTVYYDELDIPSIPNRDFETDDMSGWDLSGAPGWEIVSELKSISSRTLHLPNPGGSVVLSPPFRIPRANYAFVASTFLNGLTAEDVYQTMTIDLINADTEQPYPPGMGLPARPLRDNEVSKDGAKELVGLVCSIRTPDTPRVRIRITTDGPMLIDYVDFRGFLHPAIASNSGWVNPNHLYFSVDDMPSDIEDTSVMHVINGNIVQGNARSGKAIVARNAETLVLRDLNIIMEDTPDNKGIEHIGGGENTGNHILSNVHLEVPTVGVFCRDYIGAAVYLNGPCTISNSTIRTDTAGIFLSPSSGQSYQDGVLISNNEIDMGFTHASMARNHYAIWVNQFNRPMIISNYLHGQGQGGINLVHDLEGEVVNNAVDMRPRSGLRFGARGTGDRLSVAGIVVRDYPEEDWSTRNRIYKNNVKIVIDPELMEPDSRVSAKAYWHRNRWAFDYQRSGNNFIYENIFTAINLQEELNSFGVYSTAAAMSFESRSPVMKEQFYNNTIRGNNVLIHGGMETPLERGVEVYNNRMVKLNIAGVDPATESRLDGFESVYSYRGGGLVLRDNTWDNGAAKEDYANWGHMGIYRADNTVVVKVEDSEQSARVGADVVISNVRGETVSQGQTDSAGEFSAVVTDFEVTGGSDSLVSENPHTITVTVNGTSRSETVDINEQMEVIITVDG